MFYQEFDPLKFFDKDFGPLVKKDGHPWSKHLNDLKKYLS
jgi:hypothetical protein